MITRTNWSDVSPMVREAALALCKGDYQRALVNGSESLSGSTLRGKASKYSSNYHRSAGSLIHRMRRAGLRVSVRVAAKNAKILVIEPDFIAEGI